MPVIASGQNIPGAICPFTCCGLGRRKSLGAYGEQFGLQETSEENPGACVVTALEEGVADWIIVTNGRQWRLYSRAAHSRATNFYEVDLVEALVASGDTDPNEAFRYWWLFFRSEAFGPADAEKPGCWLDTIAQGSRDYAKQLGERLKSRVFLDIFPYLARGFLEDRKRRLGVGKRPSEEELHDTYEATLTLLYRLLFLLFAEARDLLPIREAPYREASLKKVKEEIAEKAGTAESEVAAKLDKAYTVKDTSLYDRLVRLCKAMDLGDPSLNVPIYNGGLFITRPDESAAREQRIARYLAEHKVPDRYLALAIDRLARDPDQKTLSLVFIDYKSLEVRHLGSIYEGLLEFKLKVAEEDLTTKAEKKKEKYIPLGKVKPKRGKMPGAVVRKGEVYLSNDKAERKASGSYYTPDPIVEYIVEHTVGPVLAEKLEKLRPRLRKVRKTFDNEFEKAQAYPVKKPSGETWAPRDFAAEKTYAAHRGLVDDLFDFRTLDPAMGSGHFLVEAVDFITDRMLTFLNQFPVNPVTFMLERTRRNILEALGEQGVAVDPDKLTEVNLLKRHVLKRCIYGVDLNPMAVELAKVSLWLDAFTIGAPLSFLDHHLRCGNSLIGATFKDLEAATSGQLFGIDYEPLLRAIRHVLQVNKMADATAAEVKQSASEYTAARRDLSGYQVVLDLLVARHFGLPNAAGLLEFGKDLDLSSRGRLLESLAAAAPTQKGEKPAVELVGEVTTLARRPDLRFFHWEIEFPEVFFGFEDANERRLKQKDRIANGTAGFDAVVGNPPYVRVESLDRQLKGYLKRIYDSVVDRCDIFVAFIEKTTTLVNSVGLGGLIVSNQFCNTDYGRNTRQFLANRRALRELVDVAPLQVFEDALTYPAIVIVSRASNDQIRVLSMESLLTQIPKGQRHDQLFWAHREDHVYVPSGALYSQRVWNVASLSDREMRALEDAPGLVPLGSICNISSSMKSGKDSVLVGKILEEHAEKYVLKIPCHSDPLEVDKRLWRKVIRPKDISSHATIAPTSRAVFWPYRDLDENNFDLLSEEQLASICARTFAHITEWRDALQARRDSGRTWQQHGRPWYSLGRVGKPSDYEPPKLLSPGEFKRPHFGLSDDDSLFPCARIIGISRCAVSVDALRTYLQSKLAEKWFRANLPPKGGGFRGMSVGNLSRLPIPRQDAEVWQTLKQCEAAETDKLIRDFVGKTS
jgi:type I restriction-modification system DNA methylase subunit